MSRLHCVACDFAEGIFRRRRVLHNEIRPVFDFSFTLFSPSNAGVELDAMNDLCRRLNPLLFPFPFPFPFLSFIFARSCVLL